MSGGSQSRGRVEHNDVHESLTSNSLKKSWAEGATVCLNKQDSTEKWQGPNSASSVICTFKCFF